MNSVSRRACFFLLAVVILSGSLFLDTSISTAEGSPAYSNFEAAQTNPLRLSADNARLFAANTPNNSLSVFDLTDPANPNLLAEIPVGIGPVSVNSRSDDEVWVVNQISNSVSIVSVSQGFVMDTIYTGPGTEPMDVVFAGTNQAYISCSRSNAIAVYDTGSHGLIATIPVYGDNPRALAVSPDGSTVYAAFALSGNATTIIPANLAPPQPPPLNPKLPPPPQVSLIVSATDPHWVQDISYKMPDNDIAIIQAGAIPSVEGYYSGVGTLNLGVAINPTTGDLFVTNTDALNLVFFEPSLRGHWVNNRVTRIQVASGAITPFDLNPGINYQILPNLQALSSAITQPTSIVFDPGGAFMYIAAFGTDRVAKVGTDGNVISFVEVALASGQGSNADPKNKRGPRGLALNAPASTLYSLDRLADTISIINTSQMSETSEIPAGTDPTPAEIKQGRGFLFDAKLSGNGTGACASCHLDADMDHLAWNLGDRSGDMEYYDVHNKLIGFHPMKGPMTTQTLRGLANVSPYHWRGDHKNFAAFNPTFNQLMGGSELSDADMTLYTNYIDSILFLPNPNENLDRTLPTSLNGGDPANGRSNFFSIHGTNGKFTCNDCHKSNPGPGTNRLIIPNFPPQPMKIPHLRNIYQKLLFTSHDPASIDGFGFSHDGTVSTLTDLLNHASFNGYTTQQKTDIASYLLCFDTGTAPAVGFTVTLNPGNVNNLGLLNEWGTLQSQAAVASIDLIARGTIMGQVHGLLYQPASNNYLSDDNNVYTQQRLIGFIQSGDTLSFMGVYPGTGSPNRRRQ